MNGMIAKDTIAAIATAPGEAGVGIIRISGSESLVILQGIYQNAQGEKRDVFEPRFMYYGKIVNQDGNNIDEALCVYMKGPRSYTGEDVVEIQCHGGSMAAQEILWRVLGKGARLAEAGEFTKRAFLNGRIDLAQAEAVMDIISAKTGRSLNVAVGQLSGRISKSVKDVMDILVELVAFIEAAIDFPEHDIEELTEEKISNGLRDALGRIESMRTGFYEGRLIRDGVKTAIVGRPNVGKSSLLNALINESKAIVTDIPGTTRDVIEEVLSIDGILVRLLDTAGLRKTADVVESIGVERTRAVIENSDLVLFVLDISEAPTEQDREISEELKHKEVIIVLNKSDKPEDPMMIAFVEKIKKIGVVQVSSKEEIGLEVLEAEIKKIVESGRATSSGNMPITNNRHRELIDRAYRNVLSAIEALELGTPLDLVSLDIRDCWENLGRITGESVMKDVAAEIFSRFCIGK